MSRTRLNAINTCLRGIGIAPVATEEDPDLDAATAAQVIDQASMDIQSRGWWFNKEGNWKLTPDSITGYISAPSSALSIVSHGASRQDPLTIRGTKIYDLFDHTFDLRPRAYSEPGSDTLLIEFIFITELPFEDMPPVGRQAVTYTARRQFAQDMEVDANRWKFQGLDEELAMAALLREHSRNTKRNSIRDNGRVSAFLQRAGGLNTTNYNYATFPKRNT